MEKNIANEEALLADLQKDLTNSSPSDYSKLSELTAKISGSESKLEKLFARWEELNQKSNSVT